MITINNSDLNLPTLGGMAIEYTEGIDLPGNLYVFGLADGGGHPHFRLDTHIIDTQGRDISIWLYKYFLAKGISCKIGLSRVPKSSPAIGVSYTMRANNIDFATRVCVFVLLAIHGFVLITPEALEEANKKEKKNNAKAPNDDDFEEDEDEVYHDDDLFDHDGDEVPVAAMPIQVQAGNVQWLQGGNQFNIYQNAMEQLQVAMNANNVQVNVQWNGEEPVVILDDV